jgi:broad specificity phosphatase PhoE
MGSPTLYLIRHAESEMNLKPELICGRSNESKLTPKGIKQAALLGRSMLRQAIIPNMVYASPAMRTMQTATVALTEMGLRTHPKTSDQLQELSQGDWEGTNRTTTYTDEVMRVLKAEGMDFKAPNGESMRDVGERMYTWSTTTIADAAEREQATVFAFTHRMSILCLAAHLHGWDQTRTYQAVTENVSYTTFILSDEGHLVLDQLGVPPLTIED